MFVSVFSPKGGVGTSTVSAIFAKALSDYGQTFLIESTQGDLEAMLGLDEFARFGFLDWITSQNATAESLNKIAVEHSPKLALVAGVVTKKPSQNKEVSEIENVRDSSKFEIGDSQLGNAIDELSKMEKHCVVDCSRGDTRLQKAIMKASDVIVLVNRQCYLSLFRSTQHDLTDDADLVVVVCENGRSISPKQIAQTLDKQILIEIDARRDFARVIDAGTLWSSTPRALISPIEEYVSDLLVGMPNEIKNHEVESVDSFQSRNSDFWGEHHKGTRSTTNPFTGHAKMLLEKRFKQ